MKTERLRLGQDIRRSGVWAPLSVFLVHLVLSLIFDAYERLPALDIPMHLFGGMAIAFFFSRSLDLLADHAIIDRIGGLSRAVLLVALTATAAVAWELAEYVSDQIFGTRLQRGPEDTLLDIALGVLGGSIMVWISWVQHNGRGVRHP